MVGGVLGDGGGPDEAGDAEAGLEVAVDDPVGVEPVADPSGMVGAGVEPLVEAADDDADAVAGEEDGTYAEGRDHVVALDRGVEDRAGHQKRSSSGAVRCSARSGAPGWRVRSMVRAPASASTERMEVGTDQVVVMASGLSAGGGVSSPRGRRKPSGGRLGRRTPQPVWVVAARSPSSSSKRRRRFASSEPSRARAAMGPMASLRAARAS